MKLYLSKGRHWTGTQADAKAAQGGTNDYQSIEVPTDKPTLMAWLNVEWRRHADELAAAQAKPIAPVGQVHEVTAVYLEDKPVLPTPRVRERPASAPAKRDMIEEIGELDGARLLNTLEAAVCRLHEVAGTDGLKQLVAHNRAWNGGGQIAFARGLGLLFMMGVAASPDVQPVATEDQA